MTDKQIIDRVNVKECKYYCNGKCERYEEFVEAEYANYSVKCICEKENDLGTYDICDYQQLKHKEKSEEKLVKQIQTICDFINNRPETFKGINGSVDKIITDYAKAKEQECETLASQLDFEVQKKECLEQEYERLRQYHNKCCEEFEKEKKEWLEKYNQVSRDFYSGKYCNAEKCQQLDKLKAENKELKKTVMQKCPQCCEIYLNPIGAKLYEALTEIKEIANSDNHHFSDGTILRYEVVNKILQKISEVEE